MNSKLIAFIILFAASGVGIYYWKNISIENTLTFESPEKMVEYALNLTLPATKKGFLQEAYAFRKQAFKKVSEGNYGAALDPVIQGLLVYPDNFDLQFQLAILLGDYSSNFSDPLKDTMINRSKAIFTKLLPEVEGQTTKEYYSFRNEYFYRFGLYKEQYENGVERVEDNWDTTYWELIGVWGYYGQGVGAANYARELLKQGNKALALEYAQKSIVAWAQFFSYDNTYYNAYVHFALALGILGYKADMMRALQHSATIIKKDLSFVEFKEVIDFINGID